MKKPIIAITAIVLLCCSQVHSRPPALANCGSTCFLNASIQVLYNIRPLTYTLLAAYPNPYSKKNDPVPYYYTEMIRKFNYTEITRTENKPFSFLCDTKVVVKEEEKDVGDNSVTLKIFDYAAYDMMKVPRCSEQDSTEFIFHLLDGLIEKGAVIGKKIGELFKFEQRSEIICPAGDISGTKEYKGEPTIISYRALNLPTQGPVNRNLTTLDDCLCEYFKEHLEEYTVEGETEKRKNCIKQSMLTSSPQIFMISLSRYSASGVKLTHNIFIPEDLNIANFVQNGPGDILAHHYSLIGVVCHAGGTGGGHYWAYVKDENAQWYNCNDSSITKISFESFKKDRDQSYFLIYQKISLSERAAKNATAQLYQKKQAEACRTVKERQLQSDLAKLQKALQQLQRNLK